MLSMKICNGFPRLMIISSPPSNDSPFIVRMFVPETSLSCLLSILDCKVVSAAALAEVSADMPVVT